MRPGEVIAARYRVERVVRHGPLSDLVRAQEEAAGRPVALKVVSFEPGDDGLRQRIEREVAILQQLDHPRIVHCFDAGVLSDGRTYLVLEWLEGQDLSEWMADRPVSLRTVLTIVEQVAEALEVAHGQGIVHRDIKPANIFVMGKPGPLDCRVLDFGVAKRAEGVGRLTQMGAILGTPNYMAPEQASAAMTVDGRADLYSLGVVAFELLAGRLPFRAANELARLARILVEDALPVRKLLPELPSAAAELIDGLLVREPDGRIASAEAVRALIRGTMGALPGRALDRVYPARALDPAEMAPNTGTVPLVPVVTEVEGPSDTVEAPVFVEDDSAQADIAPQDPFFGREAVLEALVTAAANAVEGQGPALQLVVGPSGVGKTRLRAAFVDKWVGDGLRPFVWSARAEARRAAVPFDFLRRLDVDGLRADTSPGEGEDAPTAFLTQAQVAAEPDEAASLRQAAGQNGLVLLIDDVQWLDRPSAAVLGALLREGTVPLAVVALADPTFADSETATSLAVLPKAHVLRLEPLAPASSRAFVASLLPAPAAEEDVDRVVRQAAGNALLLEQLTLAALETGRWTPVDGRMQWSADDAGVPDLGKLIFERLAGRTLLSRRVLTAAAVLGPVFWMEAAAYLSGLSEAIVAEELEALTEARWVRPRQRSRYPGNDELEFTHDALQLAARARLHRQRREALEGRAAAYLARVGEAEPSVLASHQVAAGQPAAAMFVAAARRALEHEDPTWAARLAEEGLAAPDAAAHADAFRAVLSARSEKAEPSTSGMAQVEAACRRCRRALRANRLGDARQAAAEAVRAAETVQSPAAQGQARLHQAEVGERMGQLREAERGYAVAQDSLRGRPQWSEALARAIGGLGRLALAAGDYAAADTQFRTALVQARTRPQPEPVVEAQWGLLEVARQLGDGAGAEEWLDQMRRTDLGPLRHARARLGQGLLALEAGRWAEAQGHLERAALEAPRAEGTLWMHALVTLTQMYRLPEALTPGLQRDRRRWVQLEGALQTAQLIAQRKRPDREGPLALARATMASLRGEPDAQAEAAAERSFIAEGYWSGEERVLAAYGLARLPGVGARASRRTAWARVMEQVEVVQARLSGRQRVQYRARPLIGVVLTALSAQSNPGVMRRR